MAVCRKRKQDEQERREGQEKKNKMNENYLPKKQTQAGIIRFCKSYQIIKLLREACCYFQGIEMENNILFGFIIILTALTAVSQAILLNNNNNQRYRICVAQFWLAGNEQIYI